MYKNSGKRFLDATLSFLLLLLMLPVLGVAFLLVKMDSKGPFFFFQERVGRNGILFRLVKIRTMTNKQRTPREQVLKDNPELTKVGGLLRRLKIDELPQLVNILIGNMSFVGPRPCLPNLVQTFNEDAQARLAVRPGLTGWAQVNGNVYLTWPERWKLDRWYVENLSFWLDIKILFKTAFVVINGEEKFIRKSNA
jgi:undecaprenyl phosphate N,N'-diacetylbacillosamine 1-phosphate transferase